MLVTREQWAYNFLLHIGAPENKKNLVTIIAWQSAEGSKARWNPLATTQPWPGASDFNSVHVKNYATQEDGLAATLKTLTHTEGRGYEPILNRLMKGKRPRRTLDAVANSAWGTGELAKSIVDDVKHYWDSYAKVPIGQ